MQNQKLDLKTTTLMSFQHLFAMFGSSILVPILFKIDVANVLFFNAIGTIIYIFLTKRKIPAYLGSSFAFLAPVFSLQGQGFSFATIQSGFFACGVVILLVSLLIKWKGSKFLSVILPSSLIGSIIIIIGLSLAKTAGDMSGFNVGLNNKTNNNTSIIVASVTLLSCVLFTTMFKNFIKLIPILLAIVVGYITSVFFGLIDFSLISKANWFSLPHFNLIKFEIKPILTIIPISLIIIAEHIGHLEATSQIMNQDLIKDPGVDKSLAGDGISTIISSLFGSVPTTTYGENIGVIALTKIFNTNVLLGAAIISLVLSFSSKFSAVISSIPTPVVGGISFLLFGIIASSGIQTFVQKKVDLSNPNELVTCAVTLVIGISNIGFDINGFKLEGMLLATLVGICMSVFFHVVNKFNRK